MEQEGVQNSLTTPIIRSKNLSRKSSSSKMYKPIVKGKKAPNEEDEAPPKPKAKPLWRKKVEKPKPKPKNFIIQNMYVLT
jgi:cell division septation protein DedD